MNGYHNKRAEMARGMKDGWCDNGDIFRKDPTGWYYFIGRSDDMFVSSGHNIYPSEVEVMLERHPDVEQATARQHALSALGMPISASAMNTNLNLQGEPLK